MAVHLKVDTGGRPHGRGTGRRPRRGAAGRRVPELELAGTWTHLALPDEPDEATTGDQLDRFDAVLEALRRAGIDPGVSTPPTRRGPRPPPVLHHLVRCGIAAGVPPAAGLPGSEDLEAALTWISAVSAIRRVPAGDGVSYGHRWTAPTDRTVVTVPVGYADGARRVRRRPGGRGAPLGGRRLPVVGVVTMDQLLVDVGDDEVAVGDEVVLIGRQGDAAVTATDGDGSGPSPTRCCAPSVRGRLATTWAELPFGRPGPAPTAGGAVDDSVGQAACTSTVMRPA